MMNELIISSSALILLLIAMRCLLHRKIAPTLQYALWLLVAARLLIPGSLFSVPVSAASLAEELYSALSITQEDPVSQTPSTPEDSTHIILPNTPVTTPAVADPYVPSVSDPSAAAAQAVNWIELIWKIGIVVTGSIFLISNLLFRRALRRSRQLISPKELPCPCSAPVYHADCVSSPCVFGLFPAIYVNSAAMSEKHFRHILVHEQTHLRHGDHIWALVRCLCLAIHWYNPLVWWAAILSRRDCELSCDSAAVNRLGENQRISYGEALVAMLIPGSVSLLHSATTMNGSKRTMRERLEFIVNRPRMLKVTLAAVAVMTLCTVLFTFGGYYEELTEDTGNRITLPVTDSLDLPVQPEIPGTAPAPSYISYTHRSDLFTLSLPAEWLSSVTPAESEDGVSFYTTDETGSDFWLLSVTPQPADWNDHSDHSMPLATFDTNGTAQTYILSYNPDQSEYLSAQMESLAGSFQSKATSAQFSKLVYHSYREDIALAIAYLPYLNWQNYLETYGPDELLTLLRTLYRFADSGRASWDQYHDLLSMTDVGLDGVYAQEFGNILQTLYESNEEQFNSVIYSVYITDIERERIASYVKYRPESQSSANNSDESISSDSEIIMGLSRGYSPSVWSVGSPTGLVVDLSEDWTLDGIRKALLNEVAEYVSGTILEGDLRSVDIAYSFRFPDEMRDGVTFTVPFHASYVDQDVSILPSGASYSVGARTGELMATIHLVGDGITAPVDDAFATGQAVYDRLGECAVIESDFKVSAQEESCDILSEIQSVLEANLLSAGLSDQCRLTSISLGSYQNPVWCPPGYEQTVSYSVSFQYSGEDDTQQFTYSGSITVTTIE